MKIKSKPRAAGILIEHGQIALIQRSRDQDLFYVFPGGGVDSTENPEQAVVREIKEELGLDVGVVRLVAESTYMGRAHYYYLLEKQGGVFGSGHGKELSRSPDSERGSVKPCWVALEDLEYLKLYPSQLADFILQSIQQGWPDQPFQFLEPGE